MLGDWSSSLVRELGPLVATKTWRSQINTSKYFFFKERGTKQAMISSICVRMFPEGSPRRRHGVRHIVGVLHSIGLQIWKTQQWPQDWKRSVFIPVLRKGNAKECSNYRTIALISHTSKVMLKIL